MSYLQQTIKAVIRPGDEAGYVAECLEIAVMTQGQTLDATVKHLQEAAALQLEGEHLRDVLTILQGFGFQQVSQRGSHVKLVRDVTEAH